MSSLYHQTFVNNQKHLAFLLDPDKVNDQNFWYYIRTIQKHQPTWILIGSSQPHQVNLDELILKLKAQISQPIIIFPGEVSQISAHANGLLYLQLLSGRNPKYLIEMQVESIPILDNLSLCIMPTTYLLIDGGVPTSVQIVSETNALNNQDYNIVYQHAKAGELFGHQLLYLEAGSGAKTPIPLDLVTYLSQKIKLPMIVGGGIKNRDQVDAYHQAGAAMVVVGTALEQQIFV